MTLSHDFSSLHTVNITELKMIALNNEFPSVLIAHESVDTLICEKLILHKKTSAVTLSLFDLNMLSSIGSHFLWEELHDSRAACFHVTNFFGITV